MSTSVCAVDSVLKRCSCMKEGIIAEMGTHAELMSNAAEYAKLYNIQADAFSTSTTSTDQTAPADVPAGGE